MKIKFLTSFAIISFITTASFATADNITTNNNYQPQGGSLSNVLSADGNSSSNNGTIGTSSSAFGNKLDSNISAVTRQDVSNNQFGNSSVGNISNNSAGGQGGAGGYATSSSGGNNVSGSNGQSQGQGMEQGQSSANTNNSGASGNTTTVSSNSVYNVPRQAAPLPGQINVQAPGTSGGNFAISTPFGGVGFGLNKTVKEMKTLLNSQAAEVDQRANSVYIENVKNACTILSEEDCADLKVRMLNRF